MRAVETKKNNNFYILKQFIKTASFAVYIALFITALLLPMNAKAAGNVHMGSALYSPEAGKEFNIGVYSEATDTDQMGDFEITLSYDPNYLVYISENGEETSGSIVIKGTAESTQPVRTMLSFRARIGGETKLTVESAVIKNQAGQTLELNALPSVPIEIKADTVLPPDSISVNGVNIEDFNKQKTEFSVTIPYSENLKIEVGPDDYYAICDTDKLEKGANTIKFLAAKEGFTSLEYTLNITAEAEPEPVEEKDNTEKRLEEKEIRESAENQEIERLNLQPVPELTLDNSSEIKKQRIMSVWILVGFVIAIAMTFLGKLIYNQIANSGRIIKRATKKTTAVSDKMRFASINQKRSASDQYFEYGLDIKLKDVVDKDKKNGGSKE